MSSVAFLGPQNAPKSSAVEASPQTPPESLQRSPDTLAGFKGPISKTPTSKGKERRNEEREGGEGRPK